MSSSQKYRLLSKNPWDTCIHEGCLLDTSGLCKGTYDSNVHNEISNLFTTSLISVRTHLVQYKCSFGKHEEDKGDCL